MNHTTSGDTPPPETIQESQPLNQNGHVVEMDIIQPNRKRSLVSFLKENLFLVLNVVGIILGFAVGLLVRPHDPSKDVILWLGMLGELYMRILKCIILPLIVCSVIDGTATTDPKTNGKIGLVALIYIVCFNSVAATLGAVFGMIVQPGSDVPRKESGDASSPDTKNLQTIDIIADFIRNMFPDNMVGAAIRVSQTQYTSIKETSEVNVSGVLVNETVENLKRYVGTESSPNLLGVIVISAALGIACSQTGKQGRAFAAFFKSGSAVIFKLFSWIKWTTPVGMASLIMASIAGLDDLGSSLKSLAKLTLVNVVVSHVVLQMIILSAIFVFIRRQNPLVFFAKSAKVVLIAFGACNSLIPYMEYLRTADQFGVHRCVSEYVLPLSMTIGRGGSAMFIALTCFFVAQYEGHEVDAGSAVVIVVLSFLSSLAVPAVSSASVVAIIIILESMGISSEASPVIGLIMAMEWFNDRVRSTSNVYSMQMSLLVTWRYGRESFEAMIAAAERDEAHKKHIPA